MLLFDGDLQILRDNFDAQEICLDDGVKDQAPEYSWMARLWFEAYNILKEKGIAVDAGIQLGYFLNKCPVFEGIELRQVYTPVGMWATCEWFTCFSLRFVNLC